MKLNNLEVGKTKEIHTQLNHNQIVKDREKFQDCGNEKIYTQIKKIEG